MVTVQLAFSYGISNRVLIIKVLHRTVYVCFIYLFLNALLLYWTTVNWVGTI